MKKLLLNETRNEKQAWLLAEKAYQLIQQSRMRDIDKKSVADEIQRTENFNLYRFVMRYTTSEK